MDIKTASIFVEDQSKALTFYTDILGFRKVNDIDLDEFRWLTVSTGDSGGQNCYWSLMRIRGESLSGSDLCRWHTGNSFSQRGYTRRV